MMRHVLKTAFLLITLLFLTCGCDSGQRLPEYKKTDVPLLRFSYNCYTEHKNYVEQSKFKLDKAYYQFFPKQADSHHISNLSGMTFYYDHALRIFFANPKYTNEKNVYDWIIIVNGTRFEVKNWRYNPDSEEQLVFCGPNWEISVVHYEKVSKE